MIVDEVCEHIWYIHVYNPVYMNLIRAHAPSTVYEHMTYGQCVCLHTRIHMNEIVWSHRDHPVHVSVSVLHDHIWLYSSYYPYSIIRGYEIHTYVSVAIVLPHMITCVRQGSRVSAPSPMKGWVSRVRRLLQRDGSLQENKQCTHVHISMLAWASHLVNASMHMHALRTLALNSILHVHTSCNCAHVCNASVPSGVLMKHYLET